MLIIKLAVASLLVGSLIVVLVASISMAMSMTLDNWEWYNKRKKYKLLPSKNEADIRAIYEDITLLKSYLDITLEEKSCRYIKLKENMKRPKRKRG